MDDQLLRSVQRQLRTIKFLLSFFFLMLLAMIAILGFIAYKVVTFTQDVQTKINNIETKTSQNIDLKGQLCSNASVKSLLGSSSGICQ